MSSKMSYNSWLNNPILSRATRWALRMTNWKNNWKYLPLRTIAFIKPITMCTHCIMISSALGNILNPAKPGHTWPAMQSGETTIVTFPCWNSITSLSPANNLPAMFAQVSLLTYSWGISYAFQFFIKIFHREQHPCIQQPAQQQSRGAVTLTRLDSSGNVFTLYSSFLQVPAAASPVKSAEAMKFVNKRSSCKVNRSDWNSRYIWQQTKVHIFFWPV